MEEEEGHQHVPSKPTIPDNRHLIPRLTHYEGSPLIEESGSTSALNVHVEKGWTVASVPEGLSGQLLLGVETGGTVRPPTGALEDANQVVTMGLGPDADCDHLRMNVSQAREGAPILLHVRVEDMHSGGIEGEKVTLTWDGGANVARRYTNERGWAVFEVPTFVDKGTYDLTAESQSGCSLQRQVDLDAIDEVGGYGVDWGVEYGS